MVPETGVEPASLAAHGPKPCVSANSTTRALTFIHCTAAGSGFNLLTAILRREHVVRFAVLVHAGE
jgi:hypothetical protein